MISRFFSNFDILGGFYPNNALHCHSKHTHYLWMMGVKKYRKNAQSTVMSLDSGSMAEVEKCVHQLVRTYRWLVKCRVLRPALLLLLRLAKAFLQKSSRILLWLLACRYNSIPEPRMDSFFWFWYNILILFYTKDLYSFCLWNDNDKI